MTKYLLQYNMFQSVCPYYNKRYTNDRKSSLRYPMFTMSYRKPEICNQASLCKDISQCASHTVFPLIYAGGVY